MKTDQHSRDISENYSLKVTPQKSAASGDRGGIFLKFQFSQHGPESGKFEGKIQEGLHPRAQGKKYQSLFI